MTYQISYDSTGKGTFRRISVPAESMAIWAGYEIGRTIGVSAIYWQEFSDEPEGDVVWLRPGHERAPATAERTLLEANEAGCREFWGATDTPEGKLEVMMCGDWPPDFSPERLESRVYGQQTLAEPKEVGGE